MKKAIFALMFALATGAMLLPTAVIAQEKTQEKKKEVTLKGELCCAKCELKTADKCTNAIEVERKNKKTGETKKVVYILDDEGATGVITKEGDSVKIKPAKEGVKLD
jgi:hypothetical protein